VAQLLFNLANVSYLFGDKEEAMENYKLSEDYVFDNPILKERMNLHSSPIADHAERKIIKEIKYQTKPVRRTHLIETIVSVFAFMFSVFIVYVFRKKILLLLK
jgi:hypothetical protein